MSARLDLKVDTDARPCQRSDLSAGFIVEGKLWCWMMQHRLATATILAADWIHSQVDGGEGLMTYSGISSTKMQTTIIILEDDKHISTCRCCQMHRELMWSNPCSQTQKTPLEKCSFKKKKTAEILGGS